MYLENTKYLFTNFWLLKNLNPQLVKFKKSGKSRCKILENLVT